ncbi:hypothetical protein TNCV_4261011 [Trichonephila clavipes]|nr:hypothetical protein TNCV_4261011 [Trichonephila clavipes]
MEAIDLFTSFANLTPSRPPPVPVNGTLWGGRGDALQEEVKNSILRFGRFEDAAGNDRTDGQIIDRSCLESDCGSYDESNSKTILWRILVL